MRETPVPAATDDPSAPPTAADDSITIRRATAGTLRAIAGPLGLAFGEDFSDQEFADFARILDTARVFGAFDAERPVGTGGSHGFRLTVPGGADIDAAGITIVGVSPSHRRRGILRRMMRTLIDDTHERGESVAVLWASEGAIYQRFGFGMATLNGTFEIERSRVAWLRPVERIGSIRVVEADEAASLFPPIYDELRLAIPGALSRTSDYWRWSILHDADYMRHGNGPKVRAVLEVDDVAQAYAIYRMKQEWEDRGPKYQVLVFEVVGRTVAAERAMWAWVMDLDLVHTIRGWRQPVPHPLQLQLAEPRRLGLLAADGLWLRVVDLVAALEARTYAAAGEVVLGVTDELCPWNDGAWRVVVDARGRATVSRAEGDPALSMTAADLGAVYLGAFSFADLVRAGRTDERVPGATAAADRLFATERAPWCATGF